MGIVIIPARGGSKRIPRKNIRLFHGRPMITYAIECAQKSGLFSRIIVSTEDEEIAQIAKSYGAEVPFMRSNAAADDFATTSDVLIEVLNELEQSASQPTWACCLYPTTPLLSPEDLQSGYQAFVKGDKDVVLAAVAFDFPVQRAFEIDKEDNVKLREPQFISNRSQDLTPAYHDAGAFYFFECSRLKETGSLWGGKVGACTIPSTRIQDIDTEADWELAAYKYQQLHQHE